MNIRELGEFGLIERFRRSIRLDSSVVKGTGDDCAVIKFTKDKHLLFTCDMLVEGVDFLRQSDPYLVGRKSVAVSLSDIAACAGIPRYCLVSLGLRRASTVQFVDKLFAGMRDICRKYRVNLVGGDLSRADKLTIDVSILGEVEKKYLALRGSAKEGDIIGVTGKLGGAIKGRHLKFIPRLQEARFLARNFRLHALTDISDGLLQDLGHILKQSRKGALLYEELIPRASQASSLNNALTGGEDFELLFTLPQPDARRLFSRYPATFKPIGKIVAAKYSLRLLDKKGKEKPVRQKGFRHF
jgi:thiamine-monophosphate kinase